MLINNMFIGIPVRVFNNPIITVRLPIKQLTGRIITMLPIKKFFFDVFVLVSTDIRKKFHFLLIVSIPIKLKKNFC